MKIAVLSDQHIHSDAAPESWELAKRAFRAASKYDHVVLAGDTFDSADAMLRDRERVGKHLAKLGLWHRDRLTIVVGNHDVFHTPHRGSTAGKVLEYAKSALSFDAKGWVRDSDIERAFDEWTAPLISAADRLDARRPFPLRKMLGHVALYAVDTAPRRTLSCANGFWQAVMDGRLRRATPVANERRVLAIHHPPKLSRQTRVTNLAKFNFPLAFPPKNYARLQQFLDDLDFAAVVCGHIHSTTTYTWPVGRSKVPAYMVGRTGGMHGKAPMFGVLSVPRRGPVLWSDVSLGEAAP